MSISDLNNDDYNRGWMAGKDSAEDEVEKLQAIIDRMIPKLREHMTDEYITYELIKEVE